jgi:hypothetical protein
MSAVRVAGLAIGLALLTSTPASGWDIKRTHERLADAAIDRFNREEAFDRYLREQLALPDGTLELLAIQRGLDAEIDEDLFSSDVLFPARGSSPSPYPI